jgi:hypothetical protein
MLRRSKKTLFETGGGLHVKPYEAQSDLENELYFTIRISAEGLPYNFDSDVPIHKFLLLPTPINKYNLLYFIL